MEPDAIALRLMVGHDAYQWPGDRPRFDFIGRRMLDHRSGLGCRVTEPDASAWRLMVGHDAYQWLGDRSRFDFISRRA